MRSLLYTAGVSLLAGCAAGGAQTPAATGAVATQSQHARISPNGAATNGLTPFVNVAGIEGPHGNHTFVTDVATATVTVWGEHGELNAVLFDGIQADPRGLATDTDQKLYVTNANFSNVIVYRKPYTSISSTLEDAGQDPGAVAVDSRGLVGVANFLDSLGGPGSVSFFAKNATTPCKTIRDPRWELFYNDAFDANGNLFIDGQSAAGQTLVGEISGGCKATAITTLSFDNTISLPGGVQVSHGNVLIGDVNAQAIYSYMAPVSGSLGSPIVVTKLAGAVAPVAFALEADAKHVRTADASSITLYAALYTYPGGAYLSKLANHVWAIGVAVYPFAQP